MASSDSQIDKPKHGCPKRAELPDINTGAQSINTAWESFLRLQPRFAGVSRVLETSEVSQTNLILLPWHKNPYLIPRPSSLSSSSSTTWTYNSNFLVAVKHICYSNSTTNLAFTALSSISSASCMCPFSWRVKHLSIL